MSAGKEILAIFTDWTWEPNSGVVSIGSGTRNVHRRENDIPVHEFNHAGESLAVVGLQDGLELAAKFPTLVKGLESGEDPVRGERSADAAGAVELLDIAGGEPGEEIGALAPKVVDLGVRGPVRRRGSTRGPARPERPPGVVDPQRSRDRNQVFVLGSGRAPSAPSAQRRRRDARERGQFADRQAPPSQQVPQTFPKSGRVARHRPRRLDVWRIRGDRARGRSSHRGVLRPP